jgi:serine/threonine-protein kinase
MSRSEQRSSVEPAKAGCEPAPDALPVTSSAADEPGDVPGNGGEPVKVALSAESAAAEEEQKSREAPTSDAAEGGASAAAGTVGGSADASAAQDTPREPPQVEPEAEAKPATEGRASTGDSLSSWGTGATKALTTDPGGSAGTASPGADHALASSSSAPSFCHRCGHTLQFDSEQCPTCAAQESDVPDALVGRSVDDRYAVLRRLGEGAMGAVYEARHLRLRKRFAMKVIRAELAQVKEFVARFEREALSCSKLEHPNCISVTDFGHAATGELYLVMEFVEGRTLADELEKGTLGVSQSLEIMRQVLMGLQHAHAAGVIHRDIKPENVMLLEGPHGQLQAKLLDFGIAKAPASDADGRPLTRAGVVFGTPEYMAPEQAVSTDVDERADIYATGTILWRMLAGRMPFEGEGPVELLSAKLAAPAPSLAKVRPRVFSASLLALVARALERKPSDRFATATEMLEALEQVQTEPGRGLAVDQSRIAALVGRGQEVVSRARELPPWARRTFLAWYRCQGVEGRPSWRRRARGLVTTVPGAWVLGAALLILLAASGVVAGVTHEAPEGVSGPPPSKPTIGRVFKRIVHAATDKEPDPAVKNRLNDARMFLAKQACREASLDLQNLLREHPQLAQAHYLLGAAEMCRKRYEEGLEAYAAALAIDDELRDDARVLEDVRQLLSVRGMRMEALKFMASKIGEPALPDLVEVASEGRKRALRHYAVELVTWLGAEDQIDWISSLSLDLAQLEKCEQRAEVVEKLRQLGDPRAIPVLRKARNARVGWIRRRYRNYCCREEIGKAIKELKRRQDDRD